LSLLVLKRRIPKKIRKLKEKGTRGTRKQRRIGRLKKKRLVREGGSTCGKNTGLTILRAEKKSKRIKLKGKGRERGVYWSSRGLGCLE